MKTQALLYTYSNFTNRIMNELEFQSGKLILKSKPTWMQIEPTTLCNIYCVMCRNQEDNVKCGEHTHPEFFKCIYDSGWMKYLQILDLNGWGETFLHPQINWFLERCAEFYHLRVQITTNGLLINDKELLKLLFKLPHVLLIFSIDSADPFDYEKIRRGASWEILINNIKILNEKMKNVRRKLATRCDCLVTQLNVHKLNDMVDFAIKYKFSRLLFFRVGHCPELEVSDDTALPAMEEAIRYAKSKGLDCSGYERYKSNEDISKVGTIGMSWRCLYPWKHMMITVDGNVVPCSFLANYKFKASMGNILKEPLEKIWNSEKYISLRKSAQAGYPEFCNVIKEYGCKTKVRFFPNIIKLK